MSSSRTRGLINRREFLGSTIALALATAYGAPAGRKWALGLNTYCLRFQRWHDRQLIDYCVAQKLDAIFLQDSQDPDLADPKHWAKVRARTKELGLHLETGGAGVLSSNADDDQRLIAVLRREIERAAGMGSPIVRARVASDPVRPARRTS